MQRWTRLRALRMIGALFALSLMLSACDPSDVLALLDGIAQEQADDTAAPEAPDKADDDVSQPDEPDASDDDEAPAKPDKPEAPAEPEPPAPDDGGGASDLSAVEREIFNTLNAARTDAGLDPLALSAEITAGAREYSCVMARTGTFQHADLRQAGVNGENIAYGYPTAAAVHQGWMNSPGHARNRMNSRWTEYGVGVCENANGTAYYTERFR